MIPKELVQYQDKLYYIYRKIKPHQIKVTSVMPGAVYTNSWAGSGIDEDRIMKDTDIAKMVKAASELSFQACVEEILIRPQLGDL